MIELKTYLEWQAQYEREGNLKVYDDDGYRYLCSEGRENEKLTYEEAQRYLIMCTVIGVGKKK